MNLQEILSMISAPKGLTSVLCGISEGDLSVLPHQKGLNATIEMANIEVLRHQKALNECKSDYAYWSILSDLEYWKVIQNILKGAELVGEDNMPDVKFEENSYVVMDAISKLSEFGKDVLLKCQNEVLSKRKQNSND